MTQICGAVNTTLSRPPTLHLFLPLFLSLSFPPLSLTLSLPPQPPLFGWTEGTAVGSKVDVYCSNLSGLQTFLFCIRSLHHLVTTWLAHLHILSTKHSQYLDGNNKLVSFTIHFSFSSWRSTCTDQKQFDLVNMYVYINEQRISIFWFSRRLNWDVPPLLDDRILFVNAFLVFSVHIVIWLFWNFFVILRLVSVSRLSVELGIMRSCC